MTLTEDQPAATIDIDALARLMSFGAPTVNVWIAQGRLPGTTTGQGKKRLFDEAQARQMAIMAAIVHLGYPAPFASVQASRFRELALQPGARLIIGPPRVLPIGQTSSNPTVTPVIASSPDEFERELARFRDGPPEFYAVVRLDQIAQRVHAFVNQPDEAEQAARTMTRKRRPSITKREGE